MLPSEQLSKEITIVGGGLTGLSLAIALRKNQVPVTLHEAGSYPRHRVCGEFISGISHDSLEALGIAELLSDAKQHSTVSWYRGDDYIEEKRLPTPALGISRFLLDQRLYEHASELGVNMHTGSRQTLRTDQEGMVWSAGRRPAKGKWIGLKAHVRGLPSRSDLEMFAGPIGYLGIAPVEDGWTNVCGLFHVDPSIEAKREALLPEYLMRNGNRKLAELLTNATWRDDSFSAVAGFHLGLQKPTEGVLCLGDAHSIIPPFTGNGMSMAFQSSEIALPELSSFAQGHRSWPETCLRIQRAMKARFATRLTVSKLIHPLLFKEISRPIFQHAPFTPVLSLLR